MPITITDPKTIKMAHELADITGLPLAAAVDLAVRDWLADVRMDSAREAVRREARALTNEERDAKLVAITDRHIKESPPLPLELERKLKRGDITYDNARIHQ